VAKGEFSFRHRFKWLVSTRSDRLLGNRSRERRFQARHCVIRPPDRIFRIAGRGLGLLGSGRSLIAEASAAFAEASALLASA